MQISNKVDVNFSICLLFQWGRIYSNINLLLNHDFLPFDNPVMTFPKGICCFALTAVPKTSVFAPFPQSFKVVLLHVEGQKRLPVLQRFLNVNTYLEPFICMTVAVYQNGAFYGGVFQGRYEQLCVMQACSDLQIFLWRSVFFRTFLYTDMCRRACLTAKVTLGNTAALRPYV